MAVYWVQQDSAMSYQESILTALVVLASDPMTHHLKYNHILQSFNLHLNQYDSLETKIASQIDCWHFNQFLVGVDMFWSLCKEKNWNNETLYILVATYCANVSKASVKKVHKWGGGKHKFSYLNFRTKL